MKKLTLLLGTATLLPVVAISGGMERTALPTAFMFETGGYADFTFRTVTTMLRITCLHQQVLCMVTFQVRLFP